MEAHVGARLMSPSTVDEREEKLLIYHHTNKLQLQLDCNRQPSLPRWLMQKFSFRPTVFEVLAFSLDRNLNFASGSEYHETEEMITIFHGMAVPSYCQFVL